MAWSQLQIELSGKDTAALESALEEAGALAITLNDAGDQPLLEPGVGETPIWEDVTLTALFDSNIDCDGIDSIASTLGGRNPTWISVEDRAWEREWLSRFAPRQFGPTLWVVPGDMTPPDPDATNVRLDPGLAFGTGDHATTSLCLEWIGARTLTGCRVLDYGCGSGILAIAALKSGAQGATAVDIDPQALLATRDNASRNDVAHLIKTLSPEALPDTQFDIVLANILAGPLIDLAAPLAAMIKPGGALALSGILHTQSEQVAGAYEASIDWSTQERLEDWVLLSGIRKKAP